MQHIHLHALGCAHQHQKLQPTKKMKSFQWYTVNIKMHEQRINELTKGGAQAKQAVSPGTNNWIWPETAFSETPAKNSLLKSS